MHMFGIPVHQQQQTHYVQRTIHTICFPHHTLYVPPPPPNTHTQPPTHQRKDYQRILAAREEAARAVLQELVDRITQGPLVLLKQCFTTKQRVRVVTRHKHGVRGVATGMQVVVVLVPAHTPIA